MSGEIPAHIHLVIRLVELAGFEPASKQGDHTLSTCLFRLKFSCCIKTRTTKHSLILFIFAINARPPMTIPDFTAPRLWTLQENGFQCDVSFPRLARELSNQTTELRLCSESISVVAR